MCTLIIKRYDLTVRNYGWAKRYRVISLRITAKNRNNCEGLVSGLIEYSLTWKTVRRAKEACIFFNENLKYQMTLYVLHFPFF